MQAGRITGIEVLNGAICRYDEAARVLIPHNDAISRRVRFLAHKPSVYFHEAGWNMEKIEFLRLRTGSPCPHCRQGKVQRVKRRDWMRRLPPSRYYKCAGCKTRFFALYWFAIRLTKGG